MKKSLKPLLVLSGLLFSFVLIFFVLEVLYFRSVYLNFPQTAPPAQMVLVYSGGENRTSVVRQWDKAAPPPVFLFSGWDYKKADLKKATGLVDDRLWVEDKSRTTDQNARYCVPLILQSGDKDLVLALPWYHLPRALFLTRFYLKGMDVMVTPYAGGPLPDHWWSSPYFRLELFKFWGSLLRILLADIGVENWPPHF